MSGGCSRKHGEEDGKKVKCIDAVSCMQRNSSSGRCATLMKCSETGIPKSGGNQVGAAPGTGSQDDNEDRRREEQAGGKKRPLLAEKRVPSSIRGNTRRVVMKGELVVLSAEQSRILDVYENATVMKRVKEVVSEIRIAVRGYVWSSTKFVKGEGSVS